MNKNLGYRHKLLYSKKLVLENNFNVKRIYMLSVKIFNFKNRIKELNSEQFIEFLVEFAEVPVASSACSMRTGLVLPPSPFAITYQMHFWSVMARSASNQKLRLFPEESTITKDLVSEDPSRECEHLSLDCRAAHRRFTRKSSLD